MTKHVVTTPAKALSLRQGMRFVAPLESSPEYRVYTVVTNRQQATNFNRRTIVASFGEAGTRTWETPETRIFQRIVEDANIVAVEL